MDKENVTYTMEQYSFFKKETLPFATLKMNQEDVLLSALSQTQKGKYHIPSTANLKQSSL